MVTAMKVYVLPQNRFNQLKEYFEYITGNVKNSISTITESYNIQRRMQGQKRGLVICNNY